MDIVAYNNERMIVSFDVSAFVPFYDLATASWRMQVRQTAESNLVAMDIPAVGEASYLADVDTGTITFIAPLSAAKNLSGSYVWDFGFTPTGGDFVRCDGGSLTMNVGVTR